ncbi:unnamed protein product [Amoebophrya sp. A120]|nr:unnamed protein product [Amoebophrya sp. A120]|eukprot:GSA120T00002070001.1
MLKLQMATFSSVSLVVPPLFPSVYEKNSKPVAECAESLQLQILRDGPVIHQLQPHQLRKDPSRPRVQNPGALVGRR